ncbi:MAG: hypothetical protein JW839_18470 [Candidatus Lokiarchaeota archaeon]|nr:hypothetical protein [Candidatus Lokiarchaeota archaeon]
MSYIPKYIMKRMFPEDSFKAVEGGLEVTMVNVISPLSVDEVPDDVENYLEATVNGTKLTDEEKKKIKIITSQKTYMLSNAKEFAGVVIPVGDKLKVFLPGKFEVGSEPEISILIKTEHPFELGGIKRKVC